MNNYEIADETYFQALMFGDNLTNAKVFPNTVWEKYQDLLAEIRFIRLREEQSNA
jgi:hypothetical protein